VSTPAAPEWDELWSLLRLLAAFRPSAGSAAVGSTWSVRERGGRAEVVAGEHPDAVLVSSGVGRVFAPRPPADAARKLFELYAPLCHPLCPPAASAASSPVASPALPPDGGASQRAGSFVVAHLGQSLDGRIGPLNGNPEAITGPEDMTHNHRMRALFDVVLVGGATVLHDNPTLTVRHVEGRNPVRVVVDPERRLSDSYGMFNDGLAPTLLLCREELRARGARHGKAEVVGVPNACSPSAVLAALRREGLPRIFIEGGGVTVSRFLAAGCLDRLQLAVSPMIMGQGKPGIDLGETLRLRPVVRRFELAHDILFECCFDAL
jgi:diaminohydroxyphosphoribosylaminopyrimidine deaminase / 5-amino-6-(5-phosphoribosylamino)uracil reductase